MKKDAAVEQCDAKNAYLNAHLELGIDIYMELPPLYHNYQKLPPPLENKPCVICKLLIPLYGTKQGAHDWYQKVKKMFGELEYMMLEADEAVFFKIEEEKYTIIVCATNDFTIIAESTESAALIKKEFGKHFEVVDLGEISWLLGVKISCDHKAQTILLSQGSYIKEIISHFGLKNAHTIVTPMEAGINLLPDSLAVSSTLLTPAKKTKFHKMIGSLIYASMMTCPDITYAVSTLSQYLKAPWTTHINTVTCVFQYLLTTKDYKLVIRGKHATIDRYLDADWASQSHCHSISSFAYFVGHGVISWSSKKQPIITFSSTEAEYVALMHASKDILWIQGLLADLASNFSYRIPTPLYCDNKGTIQLSKNATFHRQTKNIDIHFHFIWKTVTTGCIKLHHCPTANMIADIFTKSLTCVKFQKFRALLGLKN